MTDEAAAYAVPGPAGTPPAGPPVSPPGTTSPDGAGAAPRPTDLDHAARVLFGDRLPLAERYAELLATEGVLRGLIGPREAPRIWDRHLLNCAAMAELVPVGSSVLDVGSGAGLPGLVLAIVRPDLSVTLIEPLARRTAFLEEAVDILGLGTVTVARARAEEVAAGAAGPGAAPGDIVTARAVAPLDRLARWCLPLTARGGRLLAMKGASAAEEVAEHQDAVRRLGGGTPTVHRCGTELLDPPTVVVEIVQERQVTVPSAPAGGLGRSGRRDRSAADGLRAARRRR